MKQTCKQVKKKKVGRPRIRTPEERMARDNAYQKEWRKKNRERWKEIHRRSYEKWRLSHPALDLSSV